MFVVMLIGSFGESALPHAGRDDSARRTAVDAGIRPHAGKTFLRVSRFVPPLTMNDVKESFFSAGAIRSTGAGGEGDFATVIRLSGNIRAETNMR
jgi:hypothetical protein